MPAYFRNMKEKTSTAAVVFTYAFAIFAVIVMVATMLLHGGFGMWTLNRDNWDTCLTVRSGIENGALNPYGSNDCYIMFTCDERYRVSDVEVTYILSNEYSNMGRQKTTYVGALGPGETYECKFTADFNFNSGDLSDLMGMMRISVQIVAVSGKYSLA